MHVLVGDVRLPIDLADAALYEAKDLGRNAWIGLLDAEATSEAELREDSRRRLDDWVSTWRVTLVASETARALTG